MLTHMGARVQPQTQPQTQTQVQAQTRKSMKTGKYTTKPEEEEKEKKKKKHGGMLSPTPITASRRDRLTSPGGAPRLPSVVVPQRHATHGCPRTYPRTLHPQPWQPGQIPCAQVPPPHLAPGQGDGSGTIEMLAPRRPHALRLVVVGSREESRRKNARLPCP